MIVNVTMMSVDGDCPSNIVIDLDKLKEIAESSKPMPEGYDEDDRNDAKLYVKNIMAEYEAYLKTGHFNDAGMPDENPDCYSVLKLVEVKLPATIDYTEVVFYG